MTGDVYTCIIIFPYLGVVLGVWFRWRVIAYNSFLIFWQKYFWSTKKKDISNRNKQENHIISFLDYKTHKNFSEACNIK